VLPKIDFVLKYCDRFFPCFINWKAQIDKLVTQLSKSCGMLFKIGTIPNIQCSNLFTVFFFIFI